MAKARIGYLKDRVQSEFWLSLFGELKTAVLSNRIACPELDFQTTEAMYDDRVEEAIKGVIDELSWGLRFRPWQSVLESQIECAAKKFRGTESEEKEPWAIAFESNPWAPVESRMQDIAGVLGRISIHLSLPEEVTQNGRQRKVDFADTAQEQIVRHIDNRPSDLPEALIQSKKAFIDGFMLTRAKRSIAQQVEDGSDLSKLRALQRAMELKDLWSRLHQIGINTQDNAIVMSFLNSGELLNSPFCDIFGSIYAVLATHYPKRRMQPGDFYDVPILATVLPYCDVVTADKFMKNILVKILRFNSRYNARIFSPDKADLSAFRDLIEGLLDNT